MVYDTSEEHLAWTASKQKKIDKKYLPKGMPFYVQHMRTSNSACGIVGKLNQVDIEDLSCSFYVHCHDSEFSEFARKYEAQLVLAKLEPDKFVETLHNFYTKMAKYIKSNGYLAKFLSFLAFFTERRENRNFTVFTAYMDLLLQQTEYLRKDQHDYNQIIAGVTTHGEPMCLKDPLPNLDLPSYEIIRTLYQKNLTSNQLDSMWPGIFAKYGYTGMTNVSDIDALQLTSRFYNNNINAMAAYINEYTSDIIPVKPMRVFFIPEEWPEQTARGKDFGYLLHNRRRTLAANGVIIKFKGSKKFDELLLKEVYYGDSICLLARLCTDQGELSCRYDTRTECFYSPFSQQDDANSLMLNGIARSLILWAYTAVVCNESIIKPTAESYLKFLKDSTGVGVEFSAIGGVLRQPGNGVGVPRKHNENYAKKISSINGYIRHLPFGQKASENAINLAESLGLRLEQDETYVQPFIRQTWVLRSPEEGNAKSKQV